VLNYCMVYRAITTYFLNKTNVRLIVTTL
jgi:hypothetical protein